MNNLVCQHPHRYVNIFTKKTKCLSCGKIVEPKFTVFNASKDRLQEKGHRPSQDNLQEEG